MYALNTNRTNLSLNMYIICAVNGNVASLNIILW